MTTPRVHCASRLPTAHESFGADGYDDPSGVGEPLRGGTGRHGGHLPGGEEVRYHAVAPATYSAFGFPGADELANMFQFNAEFAGEYCATRNLTTSRSLHPNLTSYTRWLEHNAASIPLA